MAVRVSTAGLSQERKDALYRIPLTFAYKEKNIMRYKSKHKPKPRLVPAYREVGDVAFLPMYWTKGKFGLTNAHNAIPQGPGPSPGAEWIPFAPKLGPRDDLQTGELAGVMRELRTHNSCALTVR